MKWSDQIYTLGRGGGEALPILLDCLVSLLETNVSLQSMILTKLAIQFVEN